MPTSLNTASNSLVNPALGSVEVTNYFDNPYGVCTYTSCEIIDGSENTINWITGASLTGNSCTFSVTTTNI
jgi:hypothetical protein